MRRMAVLLALVPGLAEACPMGLALYTDTATGAELRFRAAQPWEQVGMTKHVMDLALPDGRVLWGSVTENMGTSRDTGHLFSGCNRPGPDDAPLSVAQIKACRVWSGVVYALQDGAVTLLPYAGDTAPESLILTDLGRQLRYEIMDSPGDEPWDQFRLSGCAE
ncbi:hypothetical protein MASR2M74_22000 [Paracoccaceae bacterium]